MYPELTLFVIVLLIFSSCAQRDHPDRVLHLPDAPTEPEFPLYSGYLEAYIQDDLYLTQQRIFYVLCEAIRIDPLDAPLVIWLNGGPGTSSLMGFMIENGPYVLEDGNLRYNDLCWNQYANVLYIETPTEVGFSRTNASVFYNDDLTATLNLKVLHDFMTRKHPRYATRDFYITGESYAGYYVPHFARAILNGLRDGNFTNGNFRGIAIGNAALDERSDTIAGRLQMFAMGMIPEKHGADLFQLWQIDPCTFQLDLPHDETYNYLSRRRGLYNTRLNCEVDFWDREEWHLSSPSREAECDWEQPMQRYLNRQDVQKSMNVIQGNETAREWIAFNDILFYSYNLPLGYHSEKVPTGVVPVFRQIIEMAKDNFRILFYTGDFDLMCPAIHVARGAALIAEENDLEEIISPKIWTYLGDFGGAQTSYRSKINNITMDVITVRGSGHFVPASQPSRAFQIINNFLSTTENLIDYSKKIRRRN